MSWGVKYLADNPEAQTKLRNALEIAFSSAGSEGRNPNIQEITEKHIPYLDATVHEIARCASTVPAVFREAVVDTEVLGYRVPKGTVLAFLETGPSMMSPAFVLDEAQRSESSQAALAEGGKNSWDPDDMTHYIPDR